MKRKSINLIKFIIIYLIASSMYIGACINFETPIYYEGYEETSIFYNIFRNVMGVPKVYNGYKGVSSEFLIQIVIKLIIAIILIVYLIKSRIENKQTKQKKSFIFIIVKMFVNMLLIFIYLVFLYATYAGIHWIR